MGHTQTDQPPWRRSAGASRFTDAMRGLRALAPRWRRLRILTVVHAGGGGTILTNEDLMREAARRHTCFILSTGPRKWTLSSATPSGIDRLREVSFAEDWQGHAAPTAERMRAFAEALTGIDIVHFRSLLGNGPEFIAAAKHAGRVVIISFHDFLAICPNIQLLDSALQHCGGVCTALDADCLAPQKWFAGMGRLKNGYVHAWRGRMSDALLHAGACVTTSESAATLLASHFPRLADGGNLRIIEHGRDGEGRSVAEAPGSRPRIVALNIVGQAKGRVLVEELMRLNAEAGAPFEFHLLGGDVPPAALGSVSHGAYQREELPALLARIRPSFSLSPSLWPETYSHTVTESWMAGVPVLASDLGAPAERIRRHGGGWLLDPRDPAQWFAVLTEAKRDPELWRVKAHEIAQMTFRGAREMAQDYILLYEKLKLAATSAPAS